jgi:UTP--glucose-1-phosphate uridylyltransferase
LDQTHRYGIVSGAATTTQLTQLSGIVEKPAPADAPSTLAVAGRYILTPHIFEELKTTPKGAGGEIQLTDAIAQLLNKEKVFAYRYQGTRYDCGSKLGFLQATVDLGEQHPQVGAAFAAWLAQRPS